MTERIYLSDPYLARRQARVLSCEKHPLGYAAVLDGTLCFPRGGGQPCEPARLGGLEVIDCFEEAGRVLHILPQPLPLGPADVEIDADRRLDHMQQHLGEHILSRVIENLYGGKISILRIEALSAHIEIDRPLTPEQLWEAQAEANRVIARNLPVLSHVTTPREAETRFGIPAGRAEAHDWVRVVEIEGFDRNACGGTHCSATGQVEELLICGAKPVRGQFRIYFACGRRARAEHRARTLALVGLQALMGAELLPELEERIRALAARAPELEEQNRLLRQRLLESDAALAAAGARNIGGRLFAAALVEEGDAKHIKAVCDAVTERHDALLLYAVQAGGQLSLIFARSKSRQPEPNLGALLRALAAQHGGRGGGSAVLAQGMMADTPGSRAAFQALALAVGRQMEEEGGGAPCQA